MKYKWDNKNVLDYAVSTAKAEGIELGIERGIEKGIERGLEQGIGQGEYNKALAIAREMKNERFDIAFIAKTTKLSIAEIKKL